MRPHIKHCIGNGLSTSAWIGGEPLIKFISHRDIYDQRLDCNMKVAELFDGRSWKWPLGWMEKYPILQLTNHLKLNNNKSDKVVWVDKKNGEGSFNIRRVWKGLSDEHLKVKWNHAVWFPQCIPEHSFILWIAIQE